MSSYFGFIPSAQLQSDIDTARQKVAAGGQEPLYPYRDKVVRGINEELIENALVQLVNFLPPSDKKDTMLKLSNFVKSTVGSLINQLMDKAPNEQVIKSVAFLDHSLNMDPTGVQRVGAELPDSLVSQIKASFEAVQAGEGKAQRAALAEQFKMFADLVIKHYMEDFNQTLELGMFKRKGADLAKSGVRKAVHIGIDKLLPSLSSDELKVFAAHYDKMLYSV